MTNPTDTPNPDVFLAMVLDRSGSMLSIAKPTQDGVNALLDDQRTLPGEVRLSLTLFAGDLQTPFVGALLDEVPPLGSDGNPYRPGGSTALLDAVGTTVKGAEGWLASHPEFTGAVKVVIVTDGQENTSRSWHIKHPAVDGDAADVAQLIAHKQADGWEFVFLGSGSDWLEKNLGHVVAKERFATYDGSGENNRAAYAGVSHSLSASRSMVGASMVAPRTRGGKVLLHDES